MSDTPYIFQFSSVLGRSPGEGKDYPLQYSGLENSMDCIAHGVAKSQTQLNDFHSLTHSVQSLSHVWLFATPWTVARQASLSITSLSSLKLMSIELVIPSSHLILCHPLLLPSVFPSIRVFSSESALHLRWPKYWNFSFSISPSNQYSGLISLQSKRLSRVFLNTTVQKILKIFIYLAVLGLSCSMWYLIPWPGMEPKPPALGAQSLSYWTTRKVPDFQCLEISSFGLQSFFFFFFFLGRARAG